MAALVEDLEGIELVGDGAEAVLLGGADETEETGRVFSYMNLAARVCGARARRGSLLPAQEPLVADLARAAARLRRVSSPGSSTRLESTRPVLGKPSAGVLRGGARRALDAEPQLTWMVGDDLDAGHRRRAAFRAEDRCCVRPGSSGPEQLERSTVVPDAGASASIALLPEWLDEQDMT
jgi:hypothetical protein